MRLTGSVAFQPANRYRLNADKSSPDRKVSAERKADTLAYSQTALRHRNTNGARDSVGQAANLEQINRIKERGDITSDQKAMTSQEI